MYAQSVTGSMTRRSEILTEASLPEQNLKTSPTTGFVLYAA